MYEILIFIGILVFILGVRIVRPMEKGVIEFLGKYQSTANPGFHWIVPFLHKMTKVNIAEQRVDVEPQNIITKDKLNAEVDAVVYFKINDAKKAIYNVTEFYSAVPSLAKTTLRAIVGKMTLTDANENRDKINQDVENELDKQTDAWGIDVIRVELQRIEPPRDVQHAMNEVVKAENEKIAAKDLATAIETKADGERRAEIKRAEGQAQAVKLKAQANAEAIKVVNESADKYFKGNAQVLKRLETVSESLKNNAKVVVPSNGELVNVIGELSGVTPVKVAKKSSTKK